MKFILDLGYTSFYIDPDMAFVKPSVDNLLSYLDKNDFVCAGQNHYVNSNIMLAKSTEDNKRLFELPIIVWLRHSPLSRSSISSFCF
jgi:hypothetical protein